MTYKISIETVTAGALDAQGFAFLVAQRIATLQEYDAHEVIVRYHATIDDMPAEERWVTLAVPAAPVEVDAAIRRTPREDGTTEFTADYEIVGPSFETKKARLFQKVSEAEGAAINAIVPPGKIRALQFREMDIRTADQSRYAAEVAGSSRIGVAPPDFVQFCEENRPADDRRFMKEQAARQDRHNQIQRWAAQLHSDIEDLTPETIDAWEMKPHE